jgi:FAD/FMN-containing dehydrogenase
MGGQVAIAGGLHLDMRRMKRVIWLRAPEHQVRVQAGITWRDLQDVLDPQNLSVRTMQSFSNFTVGGAVSVNCHGRYVGHGPIVQSVRALQLVLADGRVVEASRQENPELFVAAIGGYGAIGVITEVELDLDDNTKMERTIEPVPLAQYTSFFADKVLKDADSVMHNADLLPPRYDAPVAITWRRTDKKLTRTNRLVPRNTDYSMRRHALWALTEVPFAGSLREPATEVVRRIRPEVAWRNHEASLDTASLEPESRVSATYALDEFFVPPRNFESFVREMGAILRKHKVSAVNVSIRHSPADTLSLVPVGARGGVLVRPLLPQGVDVPAQRAVGEWTRELIDATLKPRGATTCRTSCTRRASSSSAPIRSGAASPAQGSRRSRRGASATRCGRNISDPVAGAAIRCSRTCSATALARLEPHLETRRYDAGDIVLRAGVASAELFGLIDGAVRIEIGDGSRRVHARRAAVLRRALGAHRRPGLGDRRRAARHARLGARGAGAVRGDGAGGGVLPQRRDAARHAPARPHRRAAGGAAARRPRAGARGGRPAPRRRARPRPAPGTRPAPSTTTCPATTSPPASSASAAGATRATATRCCCSACRSRAASRCSRISTPTT